jgi:large subunit ribosomal protein L3
MKFILGTKIGMTQVFREDGTVVPVTRVKAGPCVITQIKTKENDGVNSVQLGFGLQKKFRLNKPTQGHLKDLDPVRHMRDFRVEGSVELKRGDKFNVSIFDTGEKVEVTGTSKGKGFQGVVKRYNFKGSPASHGHKDQLRMPGSIGATDAARVFKGTRMGGHMGDDRTTVKNLEIIEVNAEGNELLIKGAIPGSRGGLLMIKTKVGEISQDQLITDAVAEEATPEATPEVTEEVKEEVVETAVEVKSEESKEESSEETSK